MNITYPTDINHIILMGGTPILPRLALALKDRGYAVSCYTSPRQEAEIGPHDGVAITVTDDINRDLPFGILTPHTLAIGVGEAWTFGPPIREALGNRLLGYMSIPLPRYRGGAHFTWAILRGETQWGGCLQLITENTVPGEFDDGDLVAEWRYEIPPWNRTPADWFTFCGERDAERIMHFIQLLRDGVAIVPTVVDESKSLFLPRLRTSEHGWIDWAQPALVIERTICAFDMPYPGARCMLFDPHYGDRLVILRGVTTDGIYQSLTPFQRGLVIGRDDRGIIIATCDSQVYVKSVVCEGVDLTPSIKLGQRFHSPVEDLERALRTQAIYTPKINQ